MRKLITFLFTILVTYSVFSQDTPPTGVDFKPLQSVAFKYNLPDSTVWMYKGVAYGWTQLATQNKLLPYIGAWKEPTIDRNLDGSVTIQSDGSYVFNIQENGKGRNVLIQNITGTSLTPPDNTTSYLCVHYNNGNPYYTFETDNLQFFYDATHLPVSRVTRIGTQLHFEEPGEYGVQLANKMLYKDVAIEPFKRQSGLTLSTAATRISTISSGVAWFAIKYYNLTANTAGSAGVLYQYYLSGGNWLKSLVTSYDADYYSDGTNRQTLNNNKWVAKYFYRDVGDDNEAYYIHGNEYNTQNEAFLEILPPVPSTVSSHSIYVGKIVIQKNATNGTAYPRTWGEGLLIGQVNDHTALTNLGWTASNHTDGANKIAAFGASGEPITIDNKSARWNQHITNDLDTIIGNEYQNLSKSKTGNNVTVNISNGTGTTFSVADSDSLITNEGVLGVSAGSSTSSVITSNTSGANGVTVNAGTGLGITETTSTNGGSITFNHLNSITAGTTTPSTNQTPAFGSTFNLPKISYDSQGHITSTGTQTVTVPTIGSGTTSYFTIWKDGANSILEDAPFTTFLSNGGFYYPQKGMLMSPPSDGDYRTVIQIQNHNPSENFFPALALYKSNNGDSISSGHVLGKIGFIGDGGAGGSKDGLGAEIVATATDTWNDFTENRPTKLEIKINKLGNGNSNPATMIEVNRSGMKVFGNEIYFPNLDPGGVSDNKKITYNTSTGKITYSNDVSLSLTTNNSSGAATYSNSTGVLNVPNYTLVGLGGQPQLNGTGFVKVSGTTVSYDNSTYLTAETDPIFSADSANLLHWSDTLNLTKGIASQYDLTTGLATKQNTLTTGNLTENITGLQFDATRQVIGGAAQLSLTSGYFIPTTTKQTNWNAAYTNRISSLTTTGSSGAATLVSNVLNIPNYSLSGLGGVPTTRTLTINGTTQDLSANRTWNVGTVTSVGLSVPTGLTVSGSPITSSGTFAISLASGYSIPTTANQTNWTTGYNDKINSLAFTGTNTKTLTLTQQDGGTVSNTFTDLDVQTLTADSTTTTIGLTVSGSNSRVHFNVDKSATNELNNSVSWNDGTNVLTVNDAGGNKTATITGFLESEVDGSTTNELQTISTTGAAGNISLSNGGGTLNLNVNDADASTTNEIQTLVKDSTTITNGKRYGISISSGNRITITDMDSYLGSSWSGTTNNSTNWNTAYTNRITSLTTTGNSGASTLISNVLNVPNYTLSGLGGVPTTRTLTINGTTYDLSANRTWTINSMVYPSAGIAVSTGSAWGTSITDNSTNWNTAYGWGNHATAGYLTAETDPVWTAASSNYYTKTNLQTSGQSSVHWNNITNSPWVLSGTSLNPSSTAYGIAVGTSLSYSSNHALMVYSNVSDRTYAAYIHNNRSNQYGLGIRAAFTSAPILSLSDGNNIPKFEFQGGGTVKFYDYGDGTKTGVFSKLAAFDSDGNIIDNIVIDTTSNFINNANWKTFISNNSQNVDLSNYYTKSNLQTSGQSLVHWGNLTNVPTLQTGTESYISNLVLSGNTLTSTGVGSAFNSTVGNIANITSANTFTQDQTISVTGAVSSLRIKDSGDLSFSSLNSDIGYFFVRNGHPYFINGDFGSTEIQLDAQGTTNHAALSNLSYATSGHTDFVSTNTNQTISGIKTFSANPEITGTNSQLTLDGTNSSIIRFELNNVFNGGMYVQNDGRIDMYAGVGTGYFNFYDGVRLPQISGSTPDNGTGMLYFDVDDNTFRGYNGSAWVDLGSSGSGNTNLSFSGTSPVTLNSSTGQDVTFRAGSNITLTRTSATNVTIAASSGATGDNISVNGTPAVDPNFVSTGQIGFTYTTGSPNTIKADINNGSIYAVDLAYGTAPTNGQIPSFNSTTGGFTWVNQGSGGSMTYPSGSGIPRVVSGSSWGTTIAIPGTTNTFLRGDGTFATIPGGFTDPMTTVGDMIYRNSSNNTVRLPKGNAGQLLTIVGNVPTWSNPFATSTAGLINYNNGGGLNATDADFTYSSLGKKLNVNNVEVSTEVYDATGWNSDFTVPTKDAIHKIMRNQGALSSTTNYTIDASSGTKAVLTLTTTTNLTISNVKDGQEGAIEIINGSSPYTLTLQSTGYTAIKKMGSKSAINPTASSHTTLVYWNTGGTLYYGFLYDN